MVKADNSDARNFSWLKQILALLAQIPISFPKHYSILLYSCHWRCYKTSKCYLLYTTTGLSAIKIQSSDQVLFFQVQVEYQVLSGKPRVQVQVFCAETLRVSSDFIRKFQIFSSKKYLKTFQVLPSTLKLRCVNYQKVCAYFMSRIVLLVQVFLISQQAVLMFK